MLQVKTSHQEGSLTPWKVTHSVYCMVLVNIKQTVENDVFYPSKPYWEDIDFAYLCEERSLVVVKCNWLIFLKVSLIYLSCIKPLNLNLRSATSLMSNAAAQSSPTLYSISLPPTWNLLLQVK